MHAAEIREDLNPLKGNYITYNICKLKNKTSYMKLYINSKYKIHTCSPTFCFVFSSLDFSFLPLLPVQPVTNSDPAMYFILFFFREVRISHKYENQQTKTYLIYTYSYLFITHTYILTQRGFSCKRMLCSSVWLKHKAWEIFFQYCSLLTIRIVDSNFSFFQTGEWPVSHSKFSWPWCWQNWLTCGRWFYLASRSLQLLKEFTPTFYLKTNIHIFF